MNIRNLMKRILQTRASILVLAFLLSAPAAPAQTRAGDSLLCFKVYQEMLQVLPAGELKRKPPQLILLPGADDTPGAWASSMPSRKGGPDEPVVLINTAMIRKGADRSRHGLAFVFGHELAHHVLGHVKDGKKLRSHSGFLQLVFHRSMEFEADSLGLRLALEAGFSRRGATDMMKRFRELGMEYSSFEGMSADHPSWSDRLAYLDEHNRVFWRSMSSFQNGTHFLALEQYATAEVCFRAVIESYPECDEAHANLGYSLLMRYCDGLEEEDLRRYNVPQILTGAFYRRPESLTRSGVRGVDDELWWDAVGALREAVRRNPSLALAHANLGLAYLLHPKGVSETADAWKHFRNALDLLPADTSADIASAAAVRLNAAAARMTAGEYDDAEKLFADLALIESLHPGELDQDFSEAYSFARADLLLRNAGGSERKKRSREALKLFREYLASAEPGAVWWTLAYEKYQQLCKTENVKAHAREEFTGGSKTRVTYRPSTALTVAGHTIALSLPPEEALKALGPCERLPVIQGRSLWRYSYPQYGIELLATEYEILSIHLTSAQAPALTIEAHGVAQSANSFSVMVGMPASEAGARLNALGKWTADPIGRTGKTWYSPFLGVGFRKSGDRISEIIIMQAPRQL